MKIKYKIILSFFFFLIIFFGLIFGLNNDILSTKQKELVNQNTLIGSDIGFLAPDFVLENLDGLMINFSMFRQKKPVILIFWSTSCPFCAKELPALKKLNQEYKNNIQIIVITIGETKKTVKDYIKNNDINFFISNDLTGSIPSYYSIKGTPEHILIDKTGRIIDKLQGSVELVSQLETFIKPALK